MTARPLAIAAAAVVLAGCGADDAETATGGDEPTTPQALAAVVAEHLGDPDRAGEESDAAEELAGDTVSAQLSYGDRGELTIAVGERLPGHLTDCDNQDLDGCEETDRGTLMWEARTPGEDPGVVYLVVDKEDADVLIFYSGPEVAADPRELDLPISVEDLLDIGNDPRVDLTTSRASVEAGERADYWRNVS